MGKPLRYFCDVMIKKKILGHVRHHSIVVRLVPDNLVLICSFCLVFINNLVRILTHP